MKTKIFKLFFSGLICVSFFATIGLNGYFDPVFAVAQEDVKESGKTGKVRKSHDSRKKPPSGAGKSYSGKSLIKKAETGEENAGQNGSVEAESVNTEAVANQTGTAPGGMPETGTTPTGIAESNKPEAVQGESIKPETGPDEPETVTEAIADDLERGGSDAGMDVTAGQYPEDSENQDPVILESGPDSASMAPSATGVESGKLVFNFDNAELSEVIRTLAELLNMNYVLDKGVSGKVTIHTAGELRREDLLPLFYQVLEINGVTAVKDGNLYKIVPLKDASRLSIMSRTDQKTPIPEGERVIIQVIPLASISAPEMTKILTPFISPEGTIVSQDRQNILLVVDRADNIDKVLRLVKVFDTDIFERVNHRFYPLQYGDAESIVEIIDKLFLPYGESIRADASFIPITRLNTLLVVSPNPRVFDTVADFIKKYDVPSQSTEPGIYVYPLKNGRAEDISGILDQVFTGKKEAKEKDKSDAAPGITRNPLGKDAKQEKEEKQAAQRETPASPVSVAMGGGEAIVSGTLRGEINITSDESRNALIIEAAPSDYQIIKNLLKQLDIMPRQVVIEVTIAEISLDESTAMGVEWSYVKGDASMSTSMLEASMSGSGLNFTIGNPDRWTAALSALATENKVNILSNPSILASNSMPASIDVSQEIPIASSSYQYTTGDDVLETDIEYRDTGIMLSVTPNINEQGLVTMDIDQEISEQAPNVSVGGQDYPSFFKRKTVTTLTVQSGQTIVIGGLIRETKSDGKSGAPWFIDLPVLNFLFGKTSDSISKTELIILISPYVIATPDDVDAVTREFKSKISSLPQHVQ